jgi:amino-acid N-acetyltransferase
MRPSGIVITGAVAADFYQIAKLLKGFSLPIDGVEAIIPDMLVLRNCRQVVGCAALEWYGPYALLRSVAVKGSLQRLGWGSALVLAILDVARTKGLKELFLLTETAPGFFQKHGFDIINRDDFPELVKQSLEFTSICSESATAMRLAFH